MLVAGATGMLGRAVATALHRTGTHVISLSRDPARAQGIRDVADTIVLGDATEPGTLSAAPSTGSTPSCPASARRWRSAPATAEVHPSEVADACLDVLGRDQDCSLMVGGPEILTRQEIVELAFRAVGTRPRILHLPRGALLAAAARPVHPRCSEVTDFAPRALTNPFVAPPSGRRRLADHFAEVVRSAPGRAPG